MAFSVKQVSFWGVGGSINGTGKRPLLHGFSVVKSNGRAVRNFTQGSAQKWTPDLDVSLRKQAEEWAVFLNTKAFLEQALGDAGPAL